MSLTIKDRPREQHYPNQFFELFTSGLSMTTKIFSHLTTVLRIRIKYIQTQSLTEISLNASRRNVNT